MLAHGLAERAEHDAQGGELPLEGGGDRHAVEHGVHGHAGQGLALLERDAELLVGLEEFGIDLVEALGGVLLGLGRRPVADGLVVDRRVVHQRPGGLGHRLPVAKGLQPPLQQPLGLALLARDEGDDLLVEAGGERVLLDVRDEAPLVVAPGEVLDLGIELGPARVELVVSEVSGGRFMRSLPSAGSPKRGCGSCARATHAGAGPSPRARSPPGRCGWRR